MIDSPIDVPIIGSAGNTPDDRSIIVGGLQGERILVPIIEPTIPVVTDQVGVAATLAKSSGASLELTSPIIVPEQTPKSYGGEITTEIEQELLRWAIDEANMVTPRVEGSFLYTRKIVNGIERMIDSRDIDTLVLPSTSTGGLLGPNITERLVTNAECDVIVVNGRPGFDGVESILLPIAGGPHSGLAADTAQRIAEHGNAWIDILHVIEEDASNHRRELAEEYVEATCHRIARPETTTTWILEAENATEAIIEQSRYYGLTVIGAPTVGRLHRFVYGSTNRNIRAEANSVVLSARNHGDAESLLE